MDNITCDDEMENTRSDHVNAMNEHSTIKDQDNTQYSKT